MKHALTALTAVALLAGCAVAPVAPSPITRAAYTPPKPYGSACTDAAAHVAGAYIGIARGADKCLAEPAKASPECLAVVVVVSQLHQTSEWTDALACMKDGRMPPEGVFLARSTMPHGEKIQRVLALYK